MKAEDEEQEEQEQEEQEEEEEQVRAVAADTDRPTMHKQPLCQGTEPSAGFRAPGMGCQRKRGMTKRSHSRGHTPCGRRRNRPQIWAAAASRVCRGQWWTKKEPVFKPTAPMLTRCVPPSGAYCAWPFSALQDSLGALLGQPVHAKGWLGAGLAQMLEADPTELEGWLIWREGWPEWRPVVSLQGSSAAELASF